MKEIILKFTNEEARTIQYYLRKKYDNPRKQLVGLCKWAVFYEVAREARKELVQLESQ